jgi:putative MATE family efflux protein
VASLIDSLPEQDIATENSARVVWALAWPAVALNSLQVINTLLDRGFIGHLPTEALTAHGGATNVLFLMFSLAMALATGATALVARAYGAEQPAEYRMASRQSLNLALLGGTLIGVITALIAPLASHAILPARDHEAIRLMTGFLLAYAAGLPAIYVIQVLAGSLRGIGDTKSPMVISGIQILLHILLNFLLIFPTRQIGGITIPGAGYGLVGAAIALSSSAWVSAIAYMIYTRRTPLGAVLHFGLPHWDWVIRILRIAIPAAAMAVLRVLSLTIFTIVLASVPNGSVAIAAMSIGFALESIMFMPAFGLSMAASALVGQSLGMRRPERAERLAWTASHHAAIVTVALALPIFVFAPGIAGLLLGHKDDVVREATNLLRLLCLTEVFFAYAMVTIGAMQGAGDTVRPLWISVIALWGLRVPFAFLFALPAGFKLFPWLALPLGMGLGATGAWLSMALTQGMQGIMAIWAFKQGAWKTKKV